MDVNDVNFSDSISAKRRAYKSSRSRQRRRRGDRYGGDGEEEEEEEDEEDDETPERKLARLRREVEELKGELVSSSNVGPRMPDDDVLELSHALDNVYASWRGGGGAATLSNSLENRHLTDTTDSSPPKDQISGLERGGILTRAAAFDDRLTLIETAMGISGSYNPFLVAGNDSDASSRSPILPSLDRLSSRLSALTGMFDGQQHTPYMEALEARVKKLTADAEVLEATRKRASEAAKMMTGATTTSATSGPEATASSTANNEELNAKIQSLYATLPTIQSLYPLLPSVLERLRSLRLIHAGAAQAAESLDAVEQRQMETNKEIQQWREALKTAEEKMLQGETAMKNNIEVVEPWVRDLEARMHRLEDSGK